MDVFLLFIHGSFIYLYISISETNKRTDYPGKEIARLVQQRWDKNYSLLKEFYIENAHVDGHVEISLNNLEKCGFPFQLYHWAKSQRIKYKSGELPQDRIEKLESLGFKWEIDPPENQWEEMYLFTSNLHLQFHL